MARLVRIFKLIGNMFSIGSNLYNWEIDKGNEEVLYKWTKVNIDYTVLLRENQILLHIKKLGT
ncbi:hypothetical protein [Metabacillus fastidiosus]|uniref:hypothetical protein n=1 Tax=Metabacillus fastidiosus TaxID=1458 RepID=UPI003D2CBBAF